MFTIFLLHGIRVGFVALPPPSLLLCCHPNLQNPSHLLQKPCRPPPLLLSKNPTAMSKKKPAAISKKFATPSQNPAIPPPLLLSKKPCRHLQSPCRCLQKPCHPISKLSENSTVPSLKPWCWNFFFAATLSSLNSFLPLAFLSVVWLSLLPLAFPGDVRLLLVLSLVPFFFSLLPLGIPWCYWPWCCSAFIAAAGLL